MCVLICVGVEMGVGAGAEMVDKLVPPEDIDTLTAPLDDQHLPLQGDQHLPLQGTKSTKVYSILHFL